MSEQEDVEITNVVPPPKKKRTTVAFRYPWFTMNVGESFIVECETVPEIRPIQQRMSSLARSAKVSAARRGIELDFMVRSVEEVKRDGSVVRGVRAWRTK